MTIFGNRLDAQDLSRYRRFELGADVAAVSALTGVAASEATIVHQRPVLLQDLAWRPSRWTLGSNLDSTDPVEQVLFSFYNDHLFRIAVDYGHDRTEGMTEADMIEAISAIYGPSVKPNVKPSVPPTRGSVRLPSQTDIESGSPVARWGDVEHGVVLYRISSYREAFRLIVKDLAVADLAKNSTSEALRLDEREAPQREIERQKKAQDDARTAAETARSVNKGLFTP